GGAAGGGGAAAAAQAALVESGIHGALARWHGDSVPGGAGGGGLDDHAPGLDSAGAGAVGLSRRAVAAPVSGDEVSQVIQQAPDIGKMILEHTADSHLIELPFGKHIHLPEGWLIPGTQIDVSPTKHVVHMLLAAFLVWLTLWRAGKAVERRHREGKAPHGF